MKKALVTGGCGFIGSAVVDNLLSRGMECVVVDNLFQNSLANLEPVLDRIRFEKIDIRNADAMERVFAEERPDMVFHLAAHHFIPYCNQNPQEAISVNIAGTQTVADCCGEFEVERLFFASTAAVYAPSEEPHQETQLPDPMDIYGVTKHVGEKITGFLSKQGVTQVAVGRFFNAVGLRETNPHILPEIVSQLQANPAGPLKLGNLFPKRDYIHVKDIADGAVILTMGLDEPFDMVNIGAGNDVTVAGLVEVCERVLGYKIPIESDPLRVRKSDRMRLRADNTKLKMKYGWSPRRNLDNAVMQVLAAASIPVSQHALAAAAAS